MSRLSLNLIQGKFWLFCQISAVVMVSSAPVSRALFNIASVFFLVFWFISGDLTSKTRIALRHPVSIPVIGLSLAIVLSATYTPAPLPDIIEHFRVYSKLILILMFLSVFENPVWRGRAWAGFVASMVLTLISTYLNVWFDLPWSKTQNQGFGFNHSVFVDYIVQGVATTIFVNFAFYKYLSNTGFSRFIWGFSIAAAVFSVAFLMQGRSGLFLLIALFILLAFIHLKRKSLLYAMASGAMFFLILIYFSPIMFSRMLEAYGDVVSYFQGSIDTPVGLRLHMWFFSAMSMFDSPFIGQGVGAYHAMAKEFFGHCNFTCFHPHNQYLFFGMENGLLGLGLYLWMIWRMFLSSKNMLPFDRNLLLGLLAVLVIDGFANAPLWYRMESYIFYSLLGVTMAAYKPSAAKVIT
jgi:O-antigen ligase